MTAQDTADTNRRTVLKSTGAVMGAGAIGHFSVGSVAAEEKTPDEIGLKEETSDFIETELWLEELPDDVQRICSGPEIYPFKRGDGKVFVSKLEEWQDVRLDSDFIFARKMGTYSSHSVGDRIVISGKPTGLRSESGAMIGMIREQLGLHLKETNEGVVVKTENEEMTIAPGEEGSIEESVTVQYRPKWEEHRRDRESSNFDTNIELVVKNTGESTLISHPNHKVYPPTHQHASHLQELLEKQQDEPDNQIQRENDIVRVMRDTVHGSYVYERYFVSGNGGDE